MRGSFEVEQDKKARCTTSCLCPQETPFITSRPGPCLSVQVQAAKSWRAGWGWLGPGRMGRGRRDECPAGRGSRALEVALGVY